MTALDLELLLATVVGWPLWAILVVRIAGNLMRYRRPY